MEGLVTGQKMPWKLSSDFESKTFRSKDVERESCMAESHKVWDKCPEISSSKNELKKKPLYHHFNTALAIFVCSFQYPPFLVS